jgi:hypothetical protein
VTHDPAVVAAYVAGELTGTPHGEFERHLLSCEECWAEVERGRQGRRLALLARESAPDALRDRITAALAGTPPPDRPWHRRRLVTLAAACLALVAVLVTVMVAVRPKSPEPMAAAVVAYRAALLPGAQIPADPAPDLTTLGLWETAASAGELAGTPVRAYAYRDRTGRRLLIYVGQRPFTSPQDAKRYEGAWVARKEGVTVLCSRPPHTTLVVGEDEQQVTDAAELLDLT